VGGVSVVDGVRERLGAALFAQVAGPDGPEHRDRIHLTEGPRWFEPGSPITRVHGDASMFVGGLRAVLLQTMHPAAMRAVHEHSGYRGDMWGRLHRTSRFLAVTTFGTAADAERAVAMVRSIHTRVTGTLPDGTPYAASDPHLLEWVHVAEAASFLRAHQVYGAQPLTPSELDEYVAQIAQVGARLGVLDPPTTYDGLLERLEAFRPELRGTPEARSAVRFVLLRPPLPVAARAPYGVIAAAAVGLMPTWTRLPLRLPWLPVSERTTVRVLGSLATGTIRWALG
jgi:uncharacterized protein (DUF2236 family)